MADLTTKTCTCGETYAVPRWLTTPTSCTRCTWAALAQRVIARLRRRKP